MLFGNSKIRSRGPILGFVLLLLLLGVVLLVRSFTRAKEDGAPPQADLAPSNRLAPSQAPAPEQGEALKSLPPAQQAAIAFQVAFGRKGTATMRSGQNREQTRFTPGKLVWAPFGPVLLSEGSVIDASHASAGQLAAIYLKASGTGFAAGKKFIPAVETGSFGELSNWSVSLNFAPNPVVYVEGGGRWQGYSCSVATLLELAPAGPVELADIPMSYSNAGTITDGGTPTELTGKITNIVEGQSFDVAYEGSRRFTDHYVRRGDKYVLASGRSLMKQC